MEVFNFEKTLMTRLNESVDVLRVTTDPVPASSVRREWSYFIEIQIEPSGWQALWRIPRVICEELHISFPTIVFGTVSSVMFTELKAEFSVIAVQDDDVHIPEINEVALEDLWPLKVQENAALNIEATANCIDMLRFFYKNIWMPWDYDNDDDSDWSDKHLESRLRFFYDMQKGTISRSLGHHIRMLLTEARYIQQRRDYLEHGIEDDMDEMNESKQQDEIADLMHLHWRMATIRNEIEILENPDMRKICEANQVEPTTNCGAFASVTGNNTFMVTTVVAIADHLRNMQALSQLIGDSERKVQFCPTLMDCLLVCSASSEIYLPIGWHLVNFLEHLNDNRTIRGLSSPVASRESRLTDKSDGLTNTAVLMTKDEDSVLMVIDGDFTIENVTMNCCNVRTGIIVRKGNVSLRDCTLIGQSASSTKVGIDVTGGATLTLTNCVLRNFATAISCNTATSIVLNECTIDGSGTAIECNDEDVQLTLTDCIISDSKRYGISLTASIEQLTDGKKETYANVDDASVKWPICGTVQFAKNAVANIVVELKPTVAPFRCIDMTNDLFELNGAADPILSVPARESVKFAVPSMPSVSIKQTKISNTSDGDGYEAAITHDTASQCTGDSISSFDDIFVSDSDMSSSVIVID